MVIGLSTPRPVVTAGVALLLVGVGAAAYAVSRSQLAQSSAGASTVALEVTPTPAASAAPAGATPTAPSAEPISAPTIAPISAPIIAAPAPKVLQLTGTTPAEFGIVRGAIVLSAPGRVPAGAHEVLT